MDGVCRLLKANPDTCGIPVIFLTARTDAADEQKGLKLVRLTTSTNHSRHRSFWQGSDSPRASEEQRLMLVVVVTVVPHGTVSADRSRETAAALGVGILCNLQPRLTPARTLTNVCLRE
jgi:hypothetical protein